MEEINITAHKINILEKKLHKAFKETNMDQVEVLQRKIDELKNVGDQFVDIPEVKQSFSIRELSRTTLGMTPDESIAAYIALRLAANAKARSRRLKEKCLQEAEEGVEDEQ